jgi:phage repressor protein C with HTH and peptisase S24 domain
VKHVRITSRGVEVRSANPRYPARHYSAESIRLIGEALLVRDVAFTNASVPRELRN